MAPVDLHILLFVRVRVCVCVWVGVCVCVCVFGMQRNLFVMIPLARGMVRGHAVLGFVQRGQIVWLALRFSECV